MRSVVGILPRNTVMSCLGGAYSQRRAGIITQIESHVTGAAKSGHSEGCPSLGMLHWTEWGRRGKTFSRVGGLGVYREARKRGVSNWRDSKGQL